MTKKEIKIKSKLFFLIAFFAILFLFGFLKTENVEAGDKTGDCMLSDEKSHYLADFWRKSGITEEVCEQECNSRRTRPSQECHFRERDEKESSVYHFFKSYKEIDNPNNLDVCKNVKLTYPTTWFNCILLYVLRLMGMLLELSATIFNWVMRPENIKSVIGNPVIYSVWAMVRDALNIVFILFLLFSAFATVFQIEKYSYKNILKMLIIMALLVNFSFPITRFIIDLSNVLMYYIADTLVMTEKGNVFVTITRDSALGNIIYQNNAAADTTSLLASIIFVFIMAITFLVVALLLVIRTIALAILIIFSSLGFVGQAIPWLSKYASEWWSSLFKYAFFGPIMLFMLYIASYMMKAISLEQMDLDTRGMGIAHISRSTSDPGVLTAMSFYVIPIIILWIGIGMAQKMGVAGADAITGKAKNFMKGAGQLAYKAPWRATKFAAKQTGIPGGIKQRFDQYKKESFFGSEKQAQREAKRAAFLGVKGAEEKDMRRRAEEHKKNNTTEKELKELASKGDAAAAYRLAEDKKMDQDTYNEFTKNTKDKTGSLNKAVNSKVKQNRVDLVAINKSNNPEELTKKSNVNGASAGGYGTNVAQYIADQQMGNLSAEQWNDQDWTDIVQPLPSGPPPPTPIQIDEWDRKILAAQTAWAALKPQAKSEVKKRLSPNNAKALATIGVG